MREILFRGKRCDNGEWVDGNLFVDEKKEKHEILVGYVNYRISWEIDPTTIGQFIGLLDRNGKKIFEGDILNADGEIYACRWDDGNFEVGLVNNKESFGIAYATLNMKVIGNIHDNPELLRGEKDGSV
jgi:uncharacterized phage protein (TIGR01671 family)